MAYADPQSIHNPATGTTPPAAWGDQVRDDLEWLARNKPHCRVYKSSAQSIANNTAVAITFDSERVDVGGMHSTSSNTNRVTIPTGGDGWYDLGGCIEFSNNATGYRQLFIRLNGLTAVASVDNNMTTAGVQMVINTRYQLVAGDYAELVVIQTSGGALNISAAGNYSPEFWATWECI